MALNDFNHIKDVITALDTLKPSRFGYRQEVLDAPAEDEVSLLTGVYAQEDTSQINSIPTPEQTALTDVVTAVGLRTQVATLSRMMINHFFGRISLNMIKLTEKVKLLVSDHLVNRYITPSGKVTENITVSLSPTKIDLIQNQSPLAAAEPTTAPLTITLPAAVSEGNAGVMTGADKKILDDTASGLATLDGSAVKLTGAQTVAGIKTFSSLPELPATNPTTDNQAARKKYVDDAVAGSSAIPMSYLDTDATMAANSDVKVPSQKAVKSNVNNIMSGIEILNFLKAMEFDSLPFSFPSTATLLKVWYLPYYQGFFIAQNQSDTEVVNYLIKDNGTVIAKNFTMWFNVFVDGYWQDPTNGDVYFIGVNSGSFASSYCLLKMQNFETPTVVALDTGLNMTSFIPVEDGSGNFLVLVEKQYIKRFNRSGVQVGSTYTMGTPAIDSLNSLKVLKASDWYGVKTYFCHNGANLYYSQNHGESWTICTGISGNIKNIEVSNNMVFVIISGGSGILNMYYSTDLNTWVNVYNRNDATIGGSGYLWSYKNLLLHQTRGTNTATGMCLEVSFNRGKTWKVLKGPLRTGYSSNFFIFTLGKYLAPDELKYITRDVSVFGLNMFKM